MKVVAYKGYLTKVTERKYKYMRTLSFTELTQLSKSDIISLVKNNYKLYQIFKRQSKVPISRTSKKDLLNFLSKKSVLKYIPRIEVVAFAGGNEVFHITELEKILKPLSDRFPYLKSLIKIAASNLDVHDYNNVILDFIDKIHTDNRELEKELPELQVFDFCYYC